MRAETPREAGAVFQDERGGGDAGEGKPAADGGFGVLPGFVGGGAFAQGEEYGAGDDVVGVFVHVGQYVAQGFGTDARERARLRGDGADGEAV